MDPKLNSAVFIDLNSVKLIIVLPFYS